MNGIRDYTAMFNDPDFARPEEWDAYAWFGFAMSEAHRLEESLRIIGRHLMPCDFCEDLPLGRLSDRAKKLLAKTEPIPPAVLKDLSVAVEKRNDLGHRYFRLRDVDPKPLEAIADLAETARLLRRLNDYFFEVMMRTVEVGATRKRKLE